jgi:hypothetical protein
MNAGVYLIWLFTRRLSIMEVIIPAAWNAMVLDG